MVINQSPTPQPQQGIKATNERSFDSILRAFVNQKMTYDAYKKLPKQIVKITAFPKGNVAEDIKRLLQGKKIGGYIVVPDYTVSTLVDYGFAQTLREKQIESLKMIFENGDVYLISGKAKFKITTVPKNNKPRAQQKVRINVKD